MPNNYLETTIKRNYRFFSETEKKVADFLLKTQEDLVTKTIANLADETGVSQATIFKFVKKLGFKGFQDFKISIAANSSVGVPDPALIAYNDITPEDSSYEIAMKVVNSNILAMKNLIPQIDKEKLENVLQILRKTKSVHFFGTGGSSVVAYDSYQKFLRTKYRCEFIMDFHMQLMSVTKFTAEDTAFVFSHSGQSVETLKLAQAIKETKAKLIVMTGNPHSELAHLADQSITVYTEESKYRTESLSSRILYLTWMDTIYINLTLQEEQQGQKSMEAIRKALSVSKTDSDYIL